MRIFTEQVLKESAEKHPEIQKLPYKILLLNEVNGLVLPISKAIFPANMDLHLKCPVRSVGN